MPSSTHSYKVSDPVHGSYTNYGYNNPYEMSEYNKYPPGGGSNNGSHKNGHSRNGSVSAHHSSSTTAIIDEDDEYERGHWGSKAEFILSCIGFSVGIGNVWRFPYLAYDNGGAVFLIPYVILLFLVGKPLYYLETAIGQFSRTSPLQVWRCAPIAKGVGFGMIVLSLIVSIYYNVIMAYSLIYVGVSVRGAIDGEMPWSNCSEWWGADENCVVTKNIENKTVLQLDKCNPALNVTTNCTDAVTSSQQFWEKYVLEITDKLGEPGDLGGFNYPIPLALLASWIVVFLCLMKGVKSSGKVVYFTATIPYVILIALLVQGVLLPGASQGLYYLFVPEWNKLWNFEVWSKAASQMFFSLGISWGGLMMFGSYNKFNNKINIDAAVVSSLDFVTSLIASIVIFSVLGALSKELDVEVQYVAAKGQGLAFVVYPEALSRLPIPWLWSILFFLMLFFLGLDSEFALLETALTAMYDGMPRLRNHKVKITFVACLSCYLLGLPCASRSGQYILDLMDTYGAGFAVIWIALWEVIGFMWIYGFKNICRDFELMLNSRPGWYWIITWVVIAPLILLIIFAASLIKWEEPKYGGEVPYPEWAHYVGWGLVLLSAVQVPLWAIIMTLYYAVKGNVSQVVKPTPEWGPGDKAVRRAIQDQQSGIIRSRNEGIYVYDNRAMSAGYM